MRRTLALTVALSLLAACGGDDDDSAADEFAGTTSSTVATQTSTESVSGEAEDASEGEEGYRPASNVDEHSAIGGDLTAMRTAMEPATKGEQVDWAAIGATFEKGGASKKGDGSVRTLAGLLAESDTIVAIREAIGGTGASAGASDAVRRQRVDKGLSVLLAEKVVEELGRARAKIEAGELEPPSTGAVHNVDEGWAFFTAQGTGPSSTAEKRAADFGREGKVKEAVLAALSHAQAASQSGNLEDFDAAVEATEQALAYIFYLATFKYLAWDNDVARAEGASFYRGIAPRVEAADAAAHKAILDAFTKANPAAGRAALNRPAVLKALGVDDAEKVTA